MSKDKKLSTEPYKGVRDFYPRDMAIQEHIFNVWKKTAQSFGYEQYNASVLEPADLYRAKSGDEIVNEQTYTFTDRGEREVTLRPEMTPTVARMVTGHRRELALPLRWYSIPNLFRYEQPQRGRVREHWQLNVDMFGIDNIEADVEVISLAYRIMKNFGAKDEDFQIKVNDRRLLQQKMEGKLINKDLYPAAVRLLDKKDKMPKDEFEKKWAELSQEPFKMDADANETIDQIITKLGEAGIKNAVYAPVLTRGFDYYTGMVFEIFDTDPENRRSIFGGGRYDDLTSLFDGDLPAGQTNKIPAVGFGVGDVTIRDFLETHNLLPPLAGAADIHICTLEERFIGDAQALAAKLREKGLNISVNLTKKKIGDQIGWADKHHIPEVIVIGENEAKSGKFKVKTLATGEEKELS